MASQGDPAVESELDTLSRVLPLPFRVATIIVLGVWAWGLNLQYLKFLGIVRLREWSDYYIRDTNTTLRTFPP